MDAIFLSSCIPRKINSVIRPLGPYQLAWYLRQHGYNIQVIDFIYMLNDKEILELIEKFITPNTKFIGLGMMVSHHHVLLSQLAFKLARVLKQVKQKYPQVKISMGGGTSHIWSERFRNKTLFDYIFKGYAEDTALALFDHLYKGAKHPPFELIDGNVHLNDTTIFTDKRLFNIEQSFHTWHVRDCIQPNEALPIEFGRGCMFKCAFCRYPHIGKNKNDFNRNIECIKEELVDNYNKFNVTSYYIVDDTFNSDKNRIEEFAKMTATLPFKIQYAAFLRADLIHANSETESMLLESGLKSVFFGIETLNTQGAAMVGKAWSGKHAKKYLPILYHNKWKKKVHMTLGFIAGIPGETLEDLRDTQKWCIENQFPCFKWHPLNVESNTGNHYRSEFDINAEKYGITWKVKDGRTIWVSDNCDSDTAVNWVHILENEGRYASKLTTWDLIEMANYGYDLDEMAKLNVDEIPWKEIDVKVKVFLNNYFEDLRSLP